MHLPPPPYAIKGRYVFPVDRDPIADGVVTVFESHIEGAGVQPTQPCERVDLGNVAILPGLVNAHVHLEFSDLNTPLGFVGIALTDWIPFVMAHRDADRRAAPSDTVQRGVAESIRCGTALLGDIATADPTVADDPPDAIDAVVFRELIGTAPARVASARAAARQHLSAASTRDPHRRGLSPHAPYSVAWPLLQDAVRLSQQFRVPLSMHVAESPEEIEWLGSGGGPLGELLASLDVPDHRAASPARRPLDFLKQLAHAHSALVIHGNYLDQAEIGYLGAKRGRTSVVYCPRTHGYFQHQPYPLRQLLAADVRVALGTDGRSSNPDLSLLSDMRRVAAVHPDVDGATILRMGTFSGAEALRCADRHGSLTAGKPAHLVIVALPDHDEPDPHDLLLRHDLPVAAVVHDGRIVYSRPGWR